MIVEHPVAAAKSGLDRLQAIAPAGGGFGPVRRIQIPRTNPHFSPSLLLHVDTVSLLLVHALTFLFVSRTFLTDASDLRGTECR